jgi:hypothetical protein
MNTEQDTLGEFDDFVVESFWTRVKARVTELGLPCTLTLTEDIDNPQLLSLNRDDILTPPISGRLGTCAEVINQLPKMLDVFVAVSATERIVTSFPSERNGVQYSQLMPTYTLSLVELDTVQLPTEPQPLVLNCSL